MRHLINLVESAEFPILYHGTKLELLDEIMKHGLTPDRDTSTFEFGPGVYLASDQDIAKSYGPLIFAVDLSMLKLRLMVPDDWELRDYFDGAWGDGTEGDYGIDEVKPTGIFEATWIDSLRICGQCKYQGVIPPAALTVLTRADA